MTRPADTDVTVIGGGMVGCTVASLLARAGLTVCVVEAGPPPSWDESGDIALRVSALSPGSAAILAQAGAWDTISVSRASAYRRMVVEDGEGGPKLEFAAPALGLERLGTIVENSAVQAALWQSLDSLAGVSLLSGVRPVRCTPRDGAVQIDLDNGKQQLSRLVVGADGAQSQVRQWLGADRDSWDYNQSGVVAVVETREPNPGVAWQRFHEGGPLAFLPVLDGRSSIVWSMPTIEATRLVEADDDTFLAALEAASSGWLGGVTGTGQRAAFPLAMGLSSIYAGRRLVLVGDAAHSVHPLAGQGVNMGFADAAALVECLLTARRLGRETGDARALRDYARWRRSEAQVMALGIHGIGGLFRPPALAPLRRLGLRWVASSRLGQSAFARRAAGVDRASPRLSRGTSLAELAQA